ncbi:MAG: hypothetical protein U0840_29310 [Gemmataceae bacterium]
MSSDRYRRLSSAIYELAWFFKRPPKDKDQMRELDEARGTIFELTKEPVYIPGEDAEIWTHRLRRVALRLRRYSENDPITPSGSEDLVFLGEAQELLLAMRPEPQRADVVQELPEEPEEGPLPPDRFRIGEATAERLTSDQYWLLDALWHQPERTISLNSLGKLYSDRKPNTSAPAEALRKLRSRVNDLLASAGMKLEIERVNDHFRIAPI